MQIEKNIGAIDVRITSAEIKSIYFTIREDGLPHISVSLYLLSATGKKVADVNLGTDLWNDNCKLLETDIPIEVYDMVGRIIQNLSPVCTRKINGIDKLLCAK